MGSSSEARAPTGSWREEFTQSASLAVPIIAVYLGYQAMGMVDTMMIGRFGTDELAAVGTGHQILSLLIYGGSGVLLGQDPLLGQALGAGDQRAFRRCVQRGVALCLAMFAPLWLLGSFAGTGLRAIGQPLEVVVLVEEYVSILLFSILPLHIVTLLRQVLQALHQTKLIVWTIIGANVLNAAANYIFIYGYAPLGIPSLGVTGSAISTLLSRVFMAAFLAWMAWPIVRPCLLPFERTAIRSRALLRAVSLGLPIGCQNVLEVGALHAALLALGYISIAAMGGHQVALQLASASFMIPLGISMAASVRVARAIGAGDHAASIRAALVPLATTVGIMTVLGTVFLTFPETLAGLFNESPEVLLIAAGTLIPIAGIFQIFDGLQVVLIGILRGAGDVRSALYANLIGFWAIGIPLGLALTFWIGVGPGGMWCGFAAGLAFTSIALGLRASALFRQPIERLSAGDDELEPATNA